VAVLFQDLVENGEERAKDRLFARTGLVERGRLLLLDNLVDGTVVEPVEACRLPQAQLTGQNPATDFGPDLHVV
jgi:hypothetical protein